MKNYQNAALGCLLACAALAGAAAVADLNASNYDEYLNSHAVVMVEYYAPWCGVCKELKPVYEQTAADLDPLKDIKFARVNCIAEPHICERYKVRIFPTIYAFRGSKKGQIYNGPREPTDMTRFVERRYKPAVAAVTGQTMEEFKDREDVTIVAYLDSEDTKSAEVFTAVAESFLDDYTFGAATDPELLTSAGVTAPAVVLYKKYDEGVARFSGEFNSETIASFIRKASFPLVGEFEPRQADLYFNEKQTPFLGIFSDIPDERRQLANEFRSIAQGTKDKLNWATVDVGKPALVKFAQRFNLRDGIWPAVAIIDGQDKYPIDQATNLTKQVVAQHVDDFVNSRLKPHFKSEPVPVTQDDPVTVIVRGNFNELVMDSANDVLLEFYAPWCGHCKKLAPEYEKLANIYAAADTHVTIAKVDATANDIPGHAVSSYPTLKFFPSNAKGSPVQYIGNRTIEDLANFVRTNSLNKVDVSAALNDKSAGVGSYVGGIASAARAIAKSAGIVKEEL